MARSGETFGKKEKEKTERQTGEKRKDGRKKGKCQERQES